MACKRIYALAQVPTNTSIYGPNTVDQGDPFFTVFINVTYAAAALQLPFSDPSTMASGSVTVSNGTQTVPGDTLVADFGPGYIEYIFVPAETYGPGDYTLYASYTPATDYVLGSSASQAYSFSVVPPVSVLPLPDSALQRHKLPFPFSSEHGKWHEAGNPIQPVCRHMLCPHCHFQATPDYKPASHRIIGMPNSCLGHAWAMCRPALEQARAACSITAAAYGGTLTKGIGPF
jgi:hypothetical protein